MVGGGAPIGTSGTRAAQYNGGLTVFVLFTCIISASGGMLFGYDNGVTGGITAMESFLNKFFPNVFSQEQNANTTNSAYCKFNDQILQLFTSSLFIAGLIASFPAAQTTKHLGRKPSMLISAVLYLIGVVLATAAPNIVVLVLGRVFLGFGVGFANQSVTLYNSEMAPAHLRGAMNILFQLAVTIGILIAQLVNYGTQHIQYYGWRVSLGIAAAPALVLLLGSIFLPETPNSLIERGHFEEGRAVLQRIRGVQDVDMEYNDIKYAVDIVSEKEKSWRAIFLREYRPQLVICMAMPFFQQFTGINAIIFYAPQLFSSFGSASGNALLSTLIIGIVNVVATLVAVFTVDRFGRRPLLLEAGFQMLGAEIAIAIILALGFQGGTLPSGLSVVVIVLICIFISSFAWSWGPLGWLIPSEICPLEIRSTGQSINVAVNFLFTFVIGQTFLSMLCSFQYGIFIFFAGWVVIMTIFAYFFIPETKGVPIEALMVTFDNHWFWKRYAPVRVAPSIALQEHKEELGKLELGEQAYS